VCGEFWGDRVTSSYTYTSRLTAGAALQREDLVPISSVYLQYNLQHDNYGMKLVDYDVKVHLAAFMLA
jgi:hypothetical protein